MKDVEVAPVKFNILAVVLPMTASVKPDGEAVPVTAVRKIFDISVEDSIVCKLPLREV